MEILNKAALTEAQINAGKDIADDLLNVFKSYSLNMGHFSNDYSSAFETEGATVVVPLKGGVGKPKTAKGDGSDDFRMGSKSGGSVTLNYTLRFVTAPLTPAERGNGAKLADWRESLAVSAVQDIQERLEDTLVAGAKKGKVGVLKVGDADSFTTRTMTRTIRPKVRKPGNEPHIWLNSDMYTAVIPLDKEGFDPDGAHYGFSGVHEYETHKDGIVGFATNESALAFASACPGSISSLQSYKTKIAFRLEEVGMSVLYVEWEDTNSGTEYGGFFWLEAMACAKDNSALLLTNKDGVATALKPFGVESTDVTLSAATSVTTAAKLTALNGVTAADLARADVDSPAEWLTLSIKSDGSEVQYKATANTAKKPRTTTFTVLYTDADGNQHYTKGFVTQPAAS